MSDSEERSKARRRPHFKSGEIEVLKQEVERHKAVLFGAFTASLTKSKKNRTWLGIAAKVNEVGTAQRTLDEVRKKWDNLKQDCKGKLATTYKPSTMRVTGGGPPEAQLPSSSDSRMMGIIGKTSICGIEGGLDSTIAQQRKLSFNFH
jgi:hypothetical protein